MPGKRAGLAALLAAASAAVAAALEIPPPPTRYVTDLAGVLRGSGAEAAEARLAELERRTGRQAIAVIFPSLEGESLEDFTIRAAERWKVGRAGQDDGVIFFAFLQERRMRLEVGYGLEATLPDALAGRLLAATVKPAFARGEYAGGILALAGGLETVLGGGSLPERRPDDDRPTPFVLVALAVLLVLLRSRGLRRGIFLGGIGGRGSGWGGGWGGSGGGFSGGGGGFGGGGASGSW